MCVLVCVWTCMRVHVCIWMCMRMSKRDKEGKKRRETEWKDWITLCGCFTCTQKPSSCKQSGKGGHKKQESVAWEALWIESLTSPLCCLSAQLSGLFPFLPLSFLLFSSLLFNSFKSSPLHRSFISSFYQHSFPFFPSLSLSFFLSFFSSFALVSSLCAPWESRVRK